MSIITAREAIRMGPYERLRRARSTPRLLVATACAICALAGAALSGCGEVNAGSPPTHTPPPAEFRPACGKPGSIVQVLSVPVTVSRRTCNLTGVELRYGLASVIVPRTGIVEGFAQNPAQANVPIHILVIVDQRSGDVTVMG